MHVALEWGTVVQTAEDDDGMDETVHEQSLGDVNSGSDGTNIKIVRRCLHSDSIATRDFKLSVAPRPVVHLHAISSVSGWTGWRRK